VAIATFVIGFAVSFNGAVSAIVIGSVIAGSVLLAPAIVLGVVAFLALVAAHGRAFRAKDRASYAARFHARALARLAGEHADDPSRGDRFLAADHPYAIDLDLFGRASLFQLLDTTTTRDGEATLASWLLAAAPHEEVRARQAAARELAANERLREDLAVEGALLAERRPDAAPLLAWAEAPPGRARGPLLIGLAFGLPGSIVALAGLAQAGLVDERLAPLAAAVTYAVNVLLAGATGPAVDAALAVEGSLAVWRDLLARAGRERFEAPRLADLSARLAGASGEIGRLSTVASFLEVRRNEAFRLMVAPFLLWDLHGALALEAWKRRSGRHVRAWLSALGELEALASLASFAVSRML
jgi:hypothetical protein